MFVFVCTGWSNLSNVVRCQISASCFWTNRWNRETKTRGKGKRGFNTSGKGKTHLSFIKIWLDPSLVVPFHFCHALVWSSLHSCKRTLVSVVSHGYCTALLSSASTRKHCCGNIIFPQMFPCLPTLGNIVAETKFASQEKHTIQKRFCCRKNVS